MTNSGIPEWNPRHWPSSDILGCNYRGQSPALSEPKVLVVGTTSDYVNLLRQSNPGRALYLSAQSERNSAVEPAPQPWEEITCDLDDDASLILGDIKDHLKRWNNSLDGLVCFDCESLELAASLAQGLSLRYPSVESIALCRDKFVSKSIWQKNGVPCPRHRLVQSAVGVFNFLQEIDRPCVIKPLSGSGSELVFICSSKKDCDKGAQMILAGLANRKNSRLYNKADSLFMAEEFVAGHEFSCDFAIRNGRAEILRLTKKLKYTAKPFGTINGYMITDFFKAGLNQKELSDILQHGAAVLGIEDAICMVDFVVDRGKVMLLEITPRPGGDCIPFLLNRASGFDILGYSLDFAQNRLVADPRNPLPAPGLAALRLHAGINGEIVKINSRRLCRDPRIQEVCLIRAAGHRVVMPPADYDSWYLGYVLFYPFPGVQVEQQCCELRRLLDLEIDYADC